jgi:hypothetical protein
MKQHKMLLAADLEHPARSTSEKIETDVGEVIYSKCLSLQ